MRHIKNIYKHEETEAFRKQLRQESFGRAERWTDRRRDFELRHPLITVYLASMAMCLPLIAFCIWILRKI